MVRFLRAMPLPVMVRQHTLFLLHKLFPFLLGSFLTHHRIINKTLDKKKRKLPVMIRKHLPPSCMNYTLVGQAHF